MKYKREVWIYTEHVDWSRGFDELRKTIEHYTLETLPMNRMEYRKQYWDFIDITDMCSEEIEMTLAIRGISKVFHHAHSKMQYPNSVLTPKYFKQHYRQLKFAK